MPLQSPHGQQTGGLGYTQKAECLPSGSLEWTRATLDRCTLLFLKAPQNWELKTSPKS